MRQAESSGMEPLALGAAAVSVVLWASAFVGIRAAGAELSPGSIALGRLAIGSVALGVLVAARGFVRPAPRDLALIALIGVTWFATYNLVLNEAERIVDAGTAAMLVDTGPVLIVILAGLFLGEGFPPLLFAGTAVALAGAILIGLATSQGAVAAGAGTPALGIVLCLVAAAVYALGVTFQKPVLRRVPALQTTWMACIVGAVLCLPFAPELAAQAGRARPDALAWLVYLGLFPTSIAFTTWAFALGRTSAGALGATTYLVPPVAIVLGALLLGEVPPALAIAGGALCILGVIVARARELRVPRVGRRAGIAAETADAD